jgi:hypothetical protein
MSAGDSAEEQRRAEWAGVLEEMEVEVLDAERSIRGNRAEEIAAWGRRMEDWTPPNMLGPLPVDLRERAARLLQHQLAVAEELVERITQSQRQRDVAARMAYRPRPVAAYVDRAL